MTASATLENYTTLTDVTEMVRNPKSERRMSAGLRSIEAVSAFATFFEAANCTIPRVLRLPPLCAAAVEPVGNAWASSFKIMQARLLARLRIPVRRA